MRLPLLALAAALTLAAPAIAQDGPKTPAGKEALAILTKSITFRTVQGSGQVPAYAAYLKEQLVSAGFDPADVTFHPIGETGYLTARYRGRDAKAKPVVLLGHMDVVEAKAAEWTRDPFVPVVEGGYIFGRGSLDNKGDVSVLVATLMKLKRSGWVPSRDLILTLTGDEETDMVTTKAAAAALKDADMVLNADAGEGSLDDAGKPTVYGLQAAEKVYADIKLTVTDEGGHSSRPDATNAIAMLIAGLSKIASYQFPPQSDAITRAFLSASAPRNPGPVGDAMRAFVADPTDAKAAATLSTYPDFVGQVRTTCVLTEIAGGHAPNALPQLATANVNCRIFPGTSFASVIAKLTELVGDPRVRIELVDSGSVEAGASPLRPDVLAAVTAAIAKRAPGLVVVPNMSAGATDSMHFRALGIPAYGVSSVFIRGSDDLAHGLNERFPLATIDPGVVQWEMMLRAIAK